MMTEIPNSNHGMLKVTNEFFSLILISITSDKYLVYYASELIIPGGFP